MSARHRAASSRPRTATGALPGSARAGGATRRATVLVTAVLYAGCTQAPTEVLCLLDTDVPSTTPFVVRAFVTTLDHPRDGGPDHTWTAGGAGDGGFTLPGSFAVLPLRGADHESVSIVVEGDGPDFRVRSIAHVTFVPHSTLVVQMFLSRRCATAATGCTQVPAVECTTGALCEERGMTCGEGGACVPVPVGALDASVANDVPATSDVVAPDAGPPCGASGQACGQDTVCTGSPAMCTPCGVGGRPCCAGGQCAAPTTCFASGVGPVCALAAGSGCSASDTCAPGYGCYGSPTSCQPCGANAEPCCAGLCTAPNNCDATGFGPVCELPAGAPCSRTQACAHDSLCYGSPPTCGPCGMHDQPCCNGFCDTGLSCNATGFGPVCQ